ncbi:hypothetical protein RhiXN_03175 [Rhizoctonia solani]|uniref:Homologous-pairing protein 2 winged helix domain-containing protein n=1 Tax=Rhizoctonia solani TaxID=456999 RepID=A0A8H8STU2_9AGAM|nr:uncharacterized protein RhiXN_03175 [Rhizoctonia solani]QRW18251.1 hypothetical protein RhiXN_03175 [Rhizoctonia solani]
MVLDKEKVAQLKGKDAEDAVLKYLKKVVPSFPNSWVNLDSEELTLLMADQQTVRIVGHIRQSQKRSFESCNAKDSALACRTRAGHSKDIWKSNVFVAPQSSTSELAPAEIDSLSAELEKTKELVKDRTVDLKRLNAELSKVKSSPTDDDLGKTSRKRRARCIERLTRALEPLRMGQAPISESDLARLDADWVRWRAEWVKRKRVFKMMWDLRADTLSSSEAAELLEDLGVEQDTSEHVELEKSELCVKAKGRK